MSAPKITADEVRRVARLAYLELPRTEPEEHLLEGAELSDLSLRLEAILGYVEELSRVELDGVPETSHGVPLPPLLRADEATTELRREDALAGAPQRVGDSFAVPKVIE